MPSNESTIILAAGPINYTNLPVGTNRSNAMIPVNGKPVIGWILDDLLNKDIREVIVVVQEGNQHLISFLDWAFGKRAALQVVMVSQGGTIVHSLAAGLRYTSSGLVRIVLGDTLITDSFAGEDDFVYVGLVDDSRRWCIAVTEADQIIRFLDKQDLPKDTYQALAGYYHLRDGEFLRQCVSETIQADDKELSHVLQKYQTKYPLKARLVTEWYDFGHIDHLMDARRRLLKARYFNSLTVDPVLNTITKVSENTEKLQDELDWYINLPKRLQVLSPRVVSTRKINGKLEVVQEYYGYPNLAELYLYGDLAGDTWDSILRLLFRIHQEFRVYGGELRIQDIMGIYVEKTWQRLVMVSQQDDFWLDIFGRDVVNYNGKILKNIYRLQPDIDCWGQALAESASICIIHGDFCFSNILFDLNSQIVRLVDPRGRFGQKGVYGDPRYDMAKLRHSICGFYDFIIADMFDLEDVGDEFRSQIYRNQDQISSRFDQLLIEAGYNLREIQFIEGLLFISMIPLHQGHYSRQLMMYLTGLSLLNKVLLG